MDTDRRAHRGPGPRAQRRPRPGALLQQRQLRTRATACGATRQGGECVSYFGYTASVPAAARGPPKCSLWNPEPRRPAGAPRRARTWNSGSAKCSRSRGSQVGRLCPGWGCGGSRAREKKPAPGASSTIGQPPLEQQQPCFWGRRRWKGPWEAAARSWKFSPCFFPSPVLAGRSHRATLRAMLGTPACSRVAAVVSGRVRPRATPNFLSPALLRRWLTHAGPASGPAHSGAAGGVEECVRRHYGV